MAGPVRTRTLVRLLQPGSASRRAREVIREVLRRAGADDEAIADAELIVAELAANAEWHARPPYELRVFSEDGVPIWCEIVDGDPDTHEVAIVLDLLRSVREIGLPLLAENGRGLLLAHRLSGGNCHVHSVTTSTTGAPGKAVAFALPAPSNARPLSSRTPAAHPASAATGRPPHLHAGVDGNTAAGAPNRKEDR
ncbi:ATP-binding protein [Sphaerisporangium perillae]|uniref:ATP-binding protein n=1 Tax=Sphaerisporangium perillae TaxID=2935860 RepID=UPI00200ECE78|nr:ATP-binding protein [Sphaerisporangium perillae]